MASREDLQHQLEDILGSRHVYYQPPESVKLVYPCIIYNMQNHDVLYSDDTRYKVRKMYSVMYISRTPDDQVSDKIAELLYASFDRRYTSDNLYHDVYTLYY